MRLLDRSCFLRLFIWLNSLFMTAHTQEVYSPLASKNHPSILLHSRTLSHQTYFIISFLLRRSNK